MECRRRRAWRDRCSLRLIGPRTRTDGHNTSTGMVFVPKEDEPLEAS